MYDNSKNFLKVVPCYGASFFYKKVLTVCCYNVNIKTQNVATI